MDIRGDLAMHLGHGRVARFAVIQNHRDSLPCYHAASNAGSNYEEELTLKGGRQMRILKKTGIVASTAMMIVCLQSIPSSATSTWASVNRACGNGSKAFNALEAKLRSDFEHSKFTAMFSDFGKFGEVAFPFAKTICETTPDKKLNAATTAFAVAMIKVSIDGMSWIGDLEVGNRSRAQIQKEDNLTIADLTNMDKWAGIVIPRLRADLKKAGL
jgi:hypothetical protein